MGRHIYWAVGLLLGLAPGCRVSDTTAPSRDDLIGSHLRGEYEAVLVWCPFYLETPASSPEAAGWCLYGLPAAMWLSLDPVHAADMVRVVCTDVPTGRLRGDDEFRSYYAGEVGRWFALPLRSQKREALLARARQPMVDQLSDLCGVESQVVAAGIDSARVQTRR